MHIVHVATPTPTAPTQTTAKNYEHELSLKVLQRDQGENPRYQKI